jgi:predicted MFS family arabinose efflux permease
MMTGITQMLAALGAMAGQMPISVLMNYLGWRHTLWVLAAIGIVLAITVWTLLKYKNTREAAYPLKNEIQIKKIISNNQTWYIAAYACLLWAPIASFASLWGVPFLTTVDHLQETTAAFLCSLMWLGLAFASPLLGMFSTAINNRVFPLSLSALIGVFSFGMILQYHLSVIPLGLFLFLAGAACSGQALTFTLVKENNSASVKATAIAFNNMAVVISGAVFQPLIGKIIESGHTGATLFSSSSHFKQGLLLVLAAYMVGFMISVGFIKEPAALE